MTAFQLYVILILDNVKLAISIGAIIFLGIPACVSFYCAMESSGSNTMKRPKWTTYIAGIGLLIGLLWGVTPSTKQMAAIYVIPPIVNNEQVQEIPQKILDLGMSWMEELGPEED